MGRIIGIDLGTTNSVAAYWNKKRPKVVENDRTQSYLIPSVVAINGDGQRIVGQDAKDRMGAGSRDVIFSIKRLMGLDYNPENPEARKILERLRGYEVRAGKDGGVEVLLGGKAYTPIEISALVLQQIKSDAEVQLGDTVTHAVITVPAYFSQRQKDATREAGRLAGLNVARIINEPTAAALAFGIEDLSDEAKYVLVYDLGGGTFDVSILLVGGGRFDVFRTGGDNFLGGDNFDNLIVDEMLTAIGRPNLQDDFVAQSMLKRHAELAKIELSRLASASRPISFLDSKGTPVDLLFKMTRDRFERLIADAIERSITITEETLAGANLDLDEISHVLLVGGSTRIPVVRNRLKALFGEDKIQIDVDPMQCVALGAAVQTAALMKEELPVEVFDPQQITGIDVGDLPAISITDVTSKHLGIKVRKPSGSDGLRVIIPRGTVFPTETPFQEVFYTNRADQQFYELPVFEVEAASDEDAERTAEGRWELVGLVVNSKLSAGLPKDTPIIVEMNIDYDGILTVSSFVKSDKAATFIARSLRMGGAGSGATAKLEDDLRFWTLYLGMVADMEVLSRYLPPGGKAQLAEASAEGRRVLDRGDAREMEAELARLKAINEKDIPAPIWELFWAYFLINSSEVQPMDRNQTQQIVSNMERAVRQNDIDVANRNLEQLRSQNKQMIDKYPSALLKAGRG